jgi:electron transfer flavoprotein alpha subunit
MNAAVILAGSLALIQKQAEELKGYIDTGFARDAQMEVWILSDQDIDLKTITFSRQIRSIQLIQVGTKHVTEEYLAAIIQLYERMKVEMMLFGSDLFAADLAVRAAYRFQGSSCVGVRDSRYDQGHCVVEKRVYAQNLTARFIMKNRPFCLSITKGFKARGERAAEPTTVEKIRFIAPVLTDWQQAYTYRSLKTTARLSDAKIVVAVGKGVGGKEKMVILEELAHLIGGKLGASRPVVMNAWTSMENLIGASGSIISPGVCLAIGVSGAAAFSVGIEKSKFIVAINNDDQAPIFKIADVAICCEYQEIVTELIKLLKSDGKWS